MKDLYRLVYTSSNLLTGSDIERTAAVSEILAISQRNNSKVGVTGALLFNGGSFAQVLEGPQKAVETTFERIQRDPRHSDVSVLQCEAVEARGFSNWSMAFIGHSVRGRALWNEIADRTGFDLARIEGDQLFATLRAIVVEEEGLTTATAPAAATPPVAVTPPVAATAKAAPGTIEMARPRGEALDVDRLRTELLDQTPEKHTGSGPARPADQAGRANKGAPPASESASAGPGIDIAVLRAALAEERERTTILRRDLDDARIGLAVARRDNDILRRERDAWAGRVRSLATALCQDPDLTQDSTQNAEAGTGTRKLKAVG